MKKIKIKISAHYYPEWNFIRQNPEGTTIYKNCEFYINKDVDECDFWFIYDGFPVKEEAVCPKENVILITGEPQSVKTYHQKFIDQYNYVFTCQEGLKHPNKINKQLIPWYVEKSYQELLEAKPEKTKLLSVICSSKAITEGHQRRLAFLEAVRQHFGDKVDIFGRGIRETPTKWDAIAPYKYHIVLENNIEKDYWTEKLADSYLAGAYPFYSGCPNIAEYFSQGSYTEIDINNFKQAIRLIEDAINNAIYENSQNELAEAKNLVLKQHNMFIILAEFATNNFNQHAKKKKIVLRSDPYFNRYKQLWTEIKRKPFIYTFNLIKSKVKL